MTILLELKGVHHTARPTWKLRETVEFYRDKMGLPLIHVIAAKGWGPDDHPDFLHFFFDSGLGGTIAFFYYLGNTQRQELVHHPKFDNDATHTAWKVDSEPELTAWRAHLEQNGVEVIYQIEHEVIESIYFRDPNGYFLEISRPIRAFCAADHNDAVITIAAAIEEEERRQAAGDKLDDITAVWRAKGDKIAELFGMSA
jgi:catechol 2,3-dioxygenase-like lactoylglutathione lyase family enzyme